MMSVTERQSPGRSRTDAVRHAFLVMALASLVLTLAAPAWAAPAAKNTQIEGVGVAYYRGHLKLGS